MYQFNKFLGSESTTHKDTFPPQATQDIDPDQDKTKPVLTTIEPVLTTGPKPVPGTEVRAIVIIINRAPCPVLRDHMIENLSIRHTAILTVGQV